MTEDELGRYVTTERKPVNPFNAVHVRPPSLVIGGVVDRLALLAIVAADDDAVRGVAEGDREDAGGRARGERS